MHFSFLSVLHFGLIKMQIGIYFIIVSNLTFCRVFETKITELQDEVLSQKGNCAKLDAQLEFSKERYNIMKNNIDTNKKVSSNRIHLR